METEARYQRLGRLIADLRQKAGKTQSDLAQLTNSSLKHIIAVEKGLTKPKLKQIPLFAKGLEVDPESLRQAAYRSEREWLLIYQSGRSI